MANSSDSTHEFGSKHTVEKLRILRKYLPAYTTALNKQAFKLHYIDAFAGTGFCDVKVGPEQRQTIEGSARIALACTPQFHSIVLIEANRRHSDALKELAESAASRSVEVRTGDANTVLPAVLGSLRKGVDRSVIFLDPYGMNLDWATLEVIARTRLPDVWYLFPLSGLYRQAARDAADIDEDKERALTRMLGTAAWKDAFYRESPQADLFSSVAAVERDVGPQQMLEWVTERLRSIFPSVLEPKVLHQTMPNGVKGAPLFALYFMVSNESHKARGLATKLVRDILKSS